MVQTIQDQLSRKEIGDLPKVKSFLDSVGRNSKQSRLTYHAAIVDFQHFLHKKYPGQTADSVLTNLVKNEINVYELLEGFVSFESSLRLSVRSIRLYITAIKSYLSYHDIDIIPSKFKRRVRVPKLYREDEEALDEKDIRKILLACNSRRLKPYLLVLASGGPRAIEALAVRLNDVDFSCSPTKLHIRKEYAKTRIARDIYISDEATQYLKSWIEWKYRNKQTRNPEDLVFGVFTKSKEPTNLYVDMRKEFARVLEAVGFGERKDGMKRRKITLHSLRRFTKTVVTNQTSQDYSERLLGHNKSPYYTVKEPERREIYASKCMKYLTFLDYTTLEATGKNIEAKISEKDSEMQAMKIKYEQEMKCMRDEMNQQFNQIMSLIQQNPKLAHAKREALATKIP